MLSSLTWSLVILFFFFAPTFFSPGRKTNWREENGLFLRGWIISGAWSQLLWNFCFLWNSWRGWFHLGCWAFISLVYMSRSWYLHFILVSLFLKKIWHIDSKSVHIKSITSYHLRNHWPAYPNLHFIILLVAFVVLDNQLIIKIFTLFITFFLFEFY